MGSQWLRFTQHQMQHSDHPPVAFALEENGNVSINAAAEEEMDFAAERLAREMFYPPQ